MRSVSLSINNNLIGFRLARIFLLAGLFLLVSAKGWGQITMNFNTDILMVYGRLSVILLFLLSDLHALQPNLKVT